MGSQSTMIIWGAVSILIGLILVPVMAQFTQDVSQDWNGTAWNDDTNVTSVSGLSSLVNLVMYGFCFGLVGLGIAMIYIGLPKGKK